MKTILHSAYSASVSREKYPGLRVQLRFRIGMAGFLAWIIAPMALMAQFKEGTVEIQERIQIENKIEINSRLEIRGRIEDNYTIRIDIVPVFTEHNTKKRKDIRRPLRGDSIKEYNLRFDLVLDKILPENYVINKNGNKNLQVSDKPIIIYFSLAENIQFNTDLHFNFTYELKTKKKANPKNNIWLKLLYDNTFGQTVQEGPTSAGSQPLSKTQRPGGGGGGAAGETKKAVPVISDTTIATGGMERLLEDYRILFAKAFELHRNKTKDSLPFNFNDITSLKDELKGFNTRYDNLILNYSHVPNADIYKKLFAAYKENSSLILIELANYLEQSDKSNANSNEKAIRGEQNKNKTLTTLLIILGAILMAIVVYFLLIKIQKNVKLNFQKKMKRKAQLELNKQKFQVTRPENKLKL